MQSFTCIFILQLTLIYTEKTSWVVFELMQKYACNYPVKPDIGNHNVILGIHNQDVVSTTMILGYGYLDLVKFSE